MTAREALDRLVDALAEDILNMSDEEILAEFREGGGDPDQLATEMRALFEKSVAIANERRAARIIADTWPARVRATIERLRKEVIAHPGEVYYQLCLRGWEQELQRIEQSLQGEKRP